MSNLDDGSLERAIAEHLESQDDWEQSEDEIALTKARAVPVKHVLVSAIKRYLENNESAVLRSAIAPHI